MKSDQSVDSPQLQAMNSPLGKPADSPLGPPMLAAPRNLSEPPLPHVAETAKPIERKILHVQGSGTYLAKALNIQGKVVEIHKFVERIDAQINKWSANRTIAQLFTEDEVCDLVNMCFARALLRSRAVEGIDSLLAQREFTSCTGQKLYTQLWAGYCAPECYGGVGGPRSKILPTNSEFVLIDIGSGELKYFLVKLNGEGPIEAREIAKEKAKDTGFHQLLASALAVLVPPPRRRPQQRSSTLRMFQNALGDDTLTQMFARQRTTSSGSDASGRDSEADSNENISEDSDSGSYSRGDSDTGSYSRGELEHPQPSLQRSSSETTRGGPVVVGELEKALSLDSHGKRRIGRFSNRQDSALHVTADAQLDSASTGVNLVRRPSFADAAREAGVDTNVPPKAPRTRTMRRRSLSQGNIMPKLPRRPRSRSGSRVKEVTFEEGVSSSRSRTSSFVDSGTDSEGAGPDAKVTELYEVLIEPIARALQTKKGEAGKAEECDEGSESETLQRVKSLQVICICTQKVRDLRDTMGARFTLAVDKLQNRFEALEKHAVTLKVLEAREEADFEMAAVRAAHVHANPDSADYPQFLQNYRLGGTLSWGRGSCQGCVSRVGKDCDQFVSLPIGLDGVEQQLNFCAKAQLVDGLRMSSSQPGAFRFAGPETFLSTVQHLRGYIEGMMRRSGSVGPDTLSLMQDEPTSGKAQMEKLTHVPQVELAFKLNNINKIDVEKARIAECDFTVMLDWIDPKLIGLKLPKSMEGRAKLLQHVWRPHLTISNAQGKVTLIDNLQNKLQVRIGEKLKGDNVMRVGHLKITQRYQAQLILVPDRSELENYPNDCHDIVIKFKLRSITDEIAPELAKKLLSVRNDGKGSSGRKTDLGRVFAELRPSPGQETMRDKRNTQKRGEGLRKEAFPRISPEARRSLRDWNLKYDRPRQVFSREGRENESQCWVGIHITRRLSTLTLVSMFIKPMMVSFIGIAQYLVPIGHPEHDTLEKGGDGAHDFLANTYMMETTVPFSDRAQLIFTLLLVFCTSGEVGLEHIFDITDQYSTACVILLFLSAVFSMVTTMLNCHEIDNKMIWDAICLLDGGGADGLSAARSFDKACFYIYIFAWLAIQISFTLAFFRRDRLQRASEGQVWIYDTYNTMKTAVCSSKRWLFCSQDWPDYQHKIVGEKDDLALLMKALISTSSDKWKVYIERLPGDSSARAHTVSPVRESVVSKNGTREQQEEEKAEGEQQEDEVVETDEDEGIQYTKLSMPQQARFFYDKHSPEKRLIVDSHEICVPDGEPRARRCVVLLEDPEFLGNDRCERVFKSLYSPQWCCCRPLRCCFTPILHWIQRMLQSGGFAQRTGLLEFLGDDAGRTQLRLAGGESRQIFRRMEARWQEREMQKEEKRRRLKNADAWRSSNKLTSSVRKAQKNIFKLSDRANIGNWDFDRFEPMDGKSVCSSSRERDVKEKRRSQVPVNKRHISQKVQHEALSVVG